MDKLIKRTPAVHQLCYGSFLQEPIAVDSRLFALPLKDLESAAQADYAGRYAATYLERSLDPTKLKTLQEEAASALPIVALICFCPSELREPHELEDFAAPHLDVVRNVLAWNTGTKPTVFAVLINTDESLFIRTIRQRSGRRYKFVFGPDEYERRVQRVMSAAQNDEQLAFVLSLFRDAVGETSPRFRMARLFSCLEGLASKLRTDGVGSREAIRLLLGRDSGWNIQEPLEGRSYSYDPIEIGGRVRDKLFHGVPFREEELRPDAQFVYRHHSWLIALHLKDDCEDEIERRANGKSRGV